jgi:hypothetical protein
MCHHKRRAGHLFFTRATTRKNAHCEQPWQGKQQCPPRSKCSKQLEDSPTQEEADEVCGVVNGEIRKVVGGGEAGGFSRRHRSSHEGRISTCGANTTLCI